MTTILTCGDNTGTTGRCDAKCHNAAGGKCHCCCNGRYHGKGKMAQEMLTGDMLGENWRDLFQPGTEPGAVLKAAKQAVLG